MKRITKTSGVLLLAASTLAQADDAAPRQGVLRDGFYAAPMFSYTRADEERRAGNGKGGVLAFGYQGDDGIAAVEVAGFYTALSGSGAAGTDTLSGASLSALVFPFARVEFATGLYGLLGVGVQTQENKTILYDAGAGYLLPFKIFSRSIALRAEGRYRLDTEQPPIEPSSKTRSFKDVVVSVGLHIPLSAEPAPPPPRPEPVEVVPLESPQ